MKDLTGNYGLVDDLTMIYSGNRLWRVTDHAGEVLLENSGNLRNPEIFDPSETQFGYDSNGNTVKDLSRSIEKMCYNAINLPLSTQLVQGTDRLTGRKTSQSISYAYDASGIRHRVVHATQPLLGTRPVAVMTADTVSYVGNYIIRNGQIDKILTPYGYMQGGRHHTFLHDYQGNVVAVIAGDSVAQRNSYYPYGLPHYTGIVKKTSFSSSSITANPYKYGGKEYDTFGGTDLYDFHARYAPSTGRFMTVDPMAEKYPGISPYIYCAGNPIAYIDPDGMQIFVNIDDMIYYYREIEKGRYGFVDDDGNEYDGDDNFIYSVEQALNTLREGEVGRTLVDEMVSCSDNFCIKHSFKMDDSWFGVDKTMINGIECYVIGWDSSSIKGGPNILSNESVSCERPSFIALGHELAHGQDRVYGRWDSSIWFVNNLDITTKVDIYATHIENMIRAEHGLPLRTHYDSRVPNSRIIMNGNLSIYYAPFRYRIKNF